MQVSGRIWPRDPFQRVGLDKWCRTHPKFAPEINSEAISGPCSGPDPQVRIKNVSLSEGKLSPGFGRAGTRRFRGSKQPPPTAKPTGKGGGLCPPTFSNRFCGRGMPHNLLPSLCDTFNIFNCGSRPENGHETAFESVSGVLLGAFCTIFQARPVGTGLGAKFGQKPAKNQNQNYNLYYLF